MYVNSNPPPPQFYAQLHAAAFPPYPPWQQQPHYPTAPHGQPGDHSAPQGATDPTAAAVAAAANHAMAQGMLTKEDEANLHGTDPQDGGSPNTMAVPGNGFVVRSGNGKKRSSKKKDEDYEPRKKRTSGDGGTSGTGRGPRSRRRAADERPIDGQSMPGSSGIVDHGDPHVMAVLDPSVTAHHDGMPVDPNVVSVPPQ